MKGFHRLHALRMENDEVRFRMDDMRDRFEGLRNRHENGTAPKAVSTWQLFQTPVLLAERMVSLLNLNGGERILEPSAGLGRILDALAPHSPSEVIAVENSKECCAALYAQERENVTILQRDFLTVAIDPVDCVAMNPPFHMRADIAHILHARSLVRPGGSLVAICMDTHHREKALRHLCDIWDPLPSGAFSESNTKTATALLRMRV